MTTKFYFTSFQKLRSYWHVSYSRFKVGLFFINPYGLPSVLRWLLGVLKFCVVYLLFEVTGIVPQNTHINLGETGCYFITAAVRYVLTLNLCFNMDF